ncbi:MAG TPA: hypothetical protein VHO48_06110 [Anaerolineaceae bacterium]|nr:hypothetical protein [Anaerolineaceae bacterium]
MNTPSKHGKAASPRTKYNARRRAILRRRFVSQFCVATLLALAAGTSLTQGVTDLPGRIIPSDVAVVSLGETPTSMPDAATSSPTQLEPSAQPSLTVTKTPILAPTHTATATLEPSATPTNTPTVTHTPDPKASPEPPILYYAQAGDTLPVVAKRFNVSPEEITSSGPIPETGFINPNQVLFIPRRLGDTTPSTQLMPDSEVVYSPSVAGFDIAAFLKDAGGYASAQSDAAEIIRKAALNNSIHPRILVGLLEYQSHWVFGQPTTLAETNYPMGDYDVKKQYLSAQVSWAIDQLSIGYYHWRDGSLTSLTFPNGETLRLAPDLNAGTVAVQYLFAQLYNREEWSGKLYDDDSFITRYEEIFGNPWLSAQTVEPMLPSTLTQPELELPFIPGQLWSFSGGPHAAWNGEGARAALDFAPGSLESGCVRSNTWATAVATGQIVRSETGIIVLDLDGDGREETGWAVLYLHVATEGRVPVGKWVSVGDPIGHPSCEGGVATGTHIHIARKYNGEWVLADGPLSFDLSGWQAHAGEAIYKGTLTKDGKTVTANTVGSIETNIRREDSE